MFFKKNHKLEENKEVSKIVTENTITTQKIKDILGKSSDVTFRRMNINGNKNLSFSSVHINGMVDSLKASEFILQPILTNEVFKKSMTTEEIVKLIEEGSIYYASQTTRKDLNEVVKDVIDGSIAIIFDKENIAFTFDVKGFEHRSVSEPTSENVRKGGKDCFVEVLRVNTATIRRRIKTSSLVFEEKLVGEQSLTKIAIIYIDGITNVEIVDNVKKKIDEIHIDDLISIGKLSEYITEKKYSLFPMIDYTERPDKFCADINEGRVGIIVDGLPLGVIVPAELAKFIQAPEDYSQDPIFSSLIRILRYILVILTVVLPGLYVAITTFHSEMIPTELAISIAQSKEGVPFPVFLEVIIMLIAFEVLVEAGLHLPRTIGQAVSIVGALVVGEAAVNAKLISPAVVIVIAAAAIASYTIPNQDLSNAIRVWRFIFVIFSSLAGLFGLYMGVILLLFILARMESFGIPYLVPYAGSKSKEISDSFLRMPNYFNEKRPSFLKTYNKKRQG
ncbi:MAG: spore gernimation protein KA [Clostridiales bacterium GWE2_32_10]|nr:MAG: spore gernimation protein KA [Clostridiales bacterium GWE2_32_10]